MTLNYEESNPKTLMGLNLHMPPIISPTNFTQEWDDQFPY